MRERISSLGKALVEELGLDPGVDTLARWMAHFIAEKITVAENSVGVEKTNAEQECFEIILKLWQHRAYFPEGRRPFENFEGIFHTLNRLDPDNPHPYFYPRLNNHSAQAEDSDLGDDEVQKWLNIALNIDQTARVWLEYALHLAAINATDEKTRTWLENSVLSEDDDAAIITQIIEVYGKENSEENTQEDKQIAREKIQSRIEKLNVFVKFSQILRAAFVSELKNDSSSDSSTIE